MKGKAQKIILFITGAVIAIAMAACGHKEDDFIRNKDGFYRLAISVSTIQTRASQEVVEKIKSLRIIIGSNDKIELNTLIDISDKKASGVIYNLLHYTTEGNKSFYLFGNEESVGNLSFDSTPGTELPQYETLSDLLNNYSAGDSFTELMSLLSTAYFEPKYEIRDNVIYLPYTAYYGGEFGLTVGDKEIVDAQFYLVPVATKFIFNFTNYREGAIRVNNITLFSSNHQNYLFAKFRDSNLKMSLPESDEKIYWIDWLAEVSKLSHNFPGASSNETFNERYGWILNYSVPPSDVAQPNVFVANTITIPAITTSTNLTGEEEEIPDPYIAGPFYVPESINGMPNSAGSNLPVQQYYLTIEFEDTVEGKEAPPFENVVIPNLKALFRNTYVIIDIKMYQGDIEIYAQVTDWNTLSANGYVTESPNPPNIN